MSTGLSPFHVPFPSFAPGLVEPHPEPAGRKTNGAQATPAWGLLTWFLQTSCLLPIIQVLTKRAPPHIILVDSPHSTLQHQNRSMYVSVYPIRVWLLHGPFPSLNRKPLPGRWLVGLVQHCIPLCLQHCLAHSKPLLKIEALFKQWQMRKAAQCRINSLAVVGTQFHLSASQSQETFSEYSTYRIGTFFWTLRT